MDGNASSSRLNDALIDFGLVLPGDEPPQPSGATSCCCLAANALRRLIKSGAVSKDAARSAFRDAVESAASVPAVAEKEVVTEGVEMKVTPVNGGDSTKKKVSRVVETAAAPPKPTAAADAGAPPAPVHRARHVALQFLYDGKKFSGFAENIGKDYDNSIEKALFAAIKKTMLAVGGAPDSATEEFVGTNFGDGDLNGEGTLPVRRACKYSRCGRTDKGVHAHGQVVALYLKSAVPPLARFPSASGAEDSEDSATKVPGDVVGDEDLPRNSVDEFVCLVPSRNKNGKKKKKKGKNGDANTDADASPQPNGSGGEPSLTLRTVTEHDYARMLNNVLPPEIRVLGWCPVSPDFSSRFSCSQRTYRYYFPRRDVDAGLVARGLQLMLGRHDFRNICKMNCEQVYNFERMIKGGSVVTPQNVYYISGGAGSEGKDDDDAGIRTEMTGCASPESPRDLCHVEIVGQAFLWHQIRCIMSILFMVGRKLEQPDVVTQLLDVEENPGKPAYDMANETALVLHNCSFANVEFGRSVKNMWDVSKKLETKWETHVVAAERARDALVSLGTDCLVRTEDLQQFVDQIATHRRRKRGKLADKKCNTGGAPAIDDILHYLPESPTMTWADALEYIRTSLGAQPFVPNGSGVGKSKGKTESTVHMLLMERSRGTTYEEKVKSILGDDGTKLDKSQKKSKKRERYEENIIHKRKTTKEDNAFYERMSQQGGSCK